MVNRTEWPQHAIRAVDRFILGVDLGQSHDYTALCVLNHRIVPTDDWIQNDVAQIWKQKANEFFDVRWLERLPLGTSYVDVVQHVSNLLARPPLNAGAKLVIDESGVGRPVGDLLDVAGLKPTRVTITSGLETTRHGPYSFHVSKAQLISGLDARLHTGELKIAAAISEAGNLADELKNFERHVTASGRNSWSARGTGNDDLVLSVAISLWFAMSQSQHSVSCGPIV
jgi:hypothetical protein